MVILLNIETFINPAHGWLRRQVRSIILSYGQINLISWSGMRNTPCHKNIISYGARPLKNQPSKTADVNFN